jgi:hypothetical protein
VIDAELSKLNGGWSLPSKDSQAEGKEAQMYTYTAQV